MRSAHDNGKSEETPVAIEYKTVGAPERGRRRKGSRTRSDKVAAAMEDILRREAVDGWEYVRTDLIPVEERSGLFGRTRDVHRAVMVFKRGSSEPADADQNPQSRAAAAPPIAADPVEVPTVPAPSPSVGPAQIAPVVPAQREEIAVPEPHRGKAEPDLRVPTRALASEIADEPLAPMPEIDDHAPPALKITRAMELHKPTLKAAKVAGDG
ncbi:MAG: hypothetical protein AAGA26_04165 [Pseudomonadota bacterium]